VFNIFACVAFKNANPCEVKAWLCASTMRDILDGKNTEMEAFKWIFLLYD
jgi:hypothetical protein